MNSKHLIILFIGLVLASCGDQAEDPIYVTINTPIFVIGTNQGTAFQNVNEYFMFHRTNLLGGFSYGKQIPVLASGLEDLLIFPGINKNTLSEQPDRYNMMEADTFTKDFIPGESVSFTPTFRYRNNVNFRVIEDFETGTGLTMDIDRDEESQFIVMPGVGYNGTSGGVMEVNSDHPLLEIGSGVPLTSFPPTGDIILEITYKNNVDIGVGVYAENNFEQNELRYHVILKASEDWNKEYIELSQKIRQNPADAYRILIGVDHRTTSGLTTSTAFIDDIKLLYLE